jgi:hypothetical protein
VAYCHTVAAYSEGRAAVCLAVPYQGVAAAAFVASEVVVVVAVFGELVGKPAAVVVAIELGVMASLEKVVAAVQREWLVGQVISMAAAVLSSLLPLHPDSSSF